MFFHLYQHVGLFLHWMGFILTTLK
jgi:hypothetical protein